MLRDDQLSWMKIEPTAPAKDASTLEGSMERNALAAMSAVRNLPKTPANLPQVASCLPLPGDRTPLQPTHLTLTGPRHFGHRSR